MNIVVTERDKKLLRLVACLAIIVIFGMYLIRPAMENHETLQNEYDAAEQKQQEYQTQIAALATIDDIIAQNEAVLNTQAKNTTRAIWKPVRWTISSRVSRSRTGCFRSH